MTTVITIGNATLYLGDCREILPSVAPDVVITDPPYGDQTHKGARSAKSLDTATIDFAPITAAELLVIARNLVAGTRRWVIMTCAWQHAAALEEPLVQEALSIFGGEIVDD